MDEAKTLALVCKIFSNEVRIKILKLLEREPHTFGSLLKNLNVNPKILNDSLSLLSEHKLVVKSYPYNVYTLTPAGRVVRQGLSSLLGYLDQVADSLCIERGGRRYP